MSKNKTKIIFTVAIDGPAAAGKGTIAQSVAKHFGFSYLDSGLLYRAVAAKMLKGEEEICAAKSINTLDLELSNLRDPEISEIASRIAKITEVRSALFKFQRSFSRKEGGAVIDGRDIATVICPQAEVKIYITAKLEVRARRRFKELKTRGFTVSFPDVIKDLEQRDIRDKNRSEAPLKVAKDAFIIDTSNLKVKAATAAAISIVEDQMQRNYQR